jgi:hypothetical protein
MLETKLLITEPKIECPIITYPHVCMAKNWSDLETVKKPAYNLGILQRDGIHFKTAVDEILYSDFGDTLFRYNKEEDIRVIGATLDEDLELKSDTAYYFYEDVMTLAKEFIQFTESSEIGIKLEIVTTDSCKFYHVDMLTYRLITTYAGATTHWMPNEYVIRSGLGQQDNTKAVTNENLYHTLPKYSVGIMKGEKQNEGKGLVHRSPPLVAGQERLILRMDVLEF